MFWEGLCFNYTELSVTKRFWLNSYGRIDIYGRAGAQWNRVPFPLLITPAANNSYIIQRSMFNMINNMEFMNDRFVSLDVQWDLSGKLFNRIPLLKHLKWREVIGFKTLYGTLTDKNNPFKQRESKRFVRVPVTERTTDQFRNGGTLLYGTECGYSQYLQDTSCGLRTPVELSERTQCQEERREIRIAV